MQSNWFMLVLVSILAVGACNRWIPVQWSPQPLTDTFAWYAYALPIATGIMFAAKLAKGTLSMELSICRTLSIAGLIAFVLLASGSHTLGVNFRPIWENIAHWHQGGAFQFAVAT